METPPIATTIKPEVVEDAITSTADTSTQPQPQPPSHELDSSPVTVSPDDVVVSDDDLDHERNIGQDRDHDHGDNPVESDVMDVLSDELKQKIIKQVEYYFSDENLPTDKFLLNTIKKNKKGFVPIYTIATFHKMKKLTRDPALIASALKESSFLVVSSDEKKVKRLSPLPEVRDPKIFTVLVENLPDDHSDENIHAIFGKAGSIKSVSICDPNAAEESDKCCKKDKFIRTRLHAFVEYETVEAAEKAAATLTNEQDWRNGMRVKLLLEQAGKYAQRRPARKEVDPEKDNTGRVHDQTGGEENKTENEHQHHYHSDTPADNDGVDKNGNKTRYRGRGRRQSHQGSNVHGTSPSSSSSFHHNYSHHHHHHQHPVEVSKPPPGPKMPDGTRGFTMGRGKPLPPPLTSAQTSHGV